LEAVSTRDPSRRCWGTIELTGAGKSSCLRTLQDEDAAVLHWHGDSFDLPSDATRLASNENYENQAFAYGGNALALQFHLEADPRQLEEWFVGHTVELAANKISVADLPAARFVPIVSSATGSHKSALWVCDFRR
jgi:GMP synthase (glutamine-hydrolysing)